MKDGTLGFVVLLLCVLGNAACSKNTPAIYTQNYTFYLNGTDTNGNAYCIAGVVTINTHASADGTFTVLGGEQDYNDGSVTTVTDDLLTGGTLAEGANGVGTLIVVTTSKIPGVMGTETFAVSFPNANHAFITQFDGTATSSGSLDLQTSRSIPSGSFSFVAYGADAAFMPIVYGGVWTVDPITAAITGTFDVNDAGHVVKGSTVPPGAALLAPDVLGRGTVMGTAGVGSTLVYYVVSLGVIRIIDVDTTDTAVGSAYSQGLAPNFSAASIGNSVFSIGSTLGMYDAVGQFVPVSGAGTFSGVGDENESVLNGNAPEISESFDGTYTLLANGYGSLNFIDGLGSISTLGVYAVDPKLNILDPNNTLTGGGALIAEMDENLVGIGEIVPQIDATPTAFSGSYAFGAQGVTGPANEFDFVGAATLKILVFTGAGALSDPLSTVTSGVESQTATFNSIANPDGTNVGRFTLNPLSVGTTGTDFTAFDFSTVTIYQAYGGQLFWIEVDQGSVFGGSIQQDLQTNLQLVN